MRKFIMFITAVCVLFLIKNYDGPITKVFNNDNDDDDKNLTRKAPSPTGDIQVSLV